MYKKTKNIKKEALKISILVIILSGTLMGGLIYTARVGAKSIEDTQSIEDAGKLTSKLLLKITSAVANYRLLGTGNAIDSMKLLDELRAINIEINKNFEDLTRVKSASSELNSIIQSQINQLSTSFQTMKKTGEEMVIAYLDDKPEEGKLLAKNLQTQSVSITSLTTTLAENVNLFSAKNSTNSIEKVNKIANIATFGSVLITLFLCLIGILFYRFLIGVLDSFAGRLNQSGEEVFRTGDQLSSIAHSLSISVKDQANKVQQTSNSISEIRKMITTNIKSAQNSEKLAQDVSLLAQETSKWMGDLKNGMKAIEDSNDRISNLASIVEQIGEKIEVIDDIVFKTQLLSFNASVEAERAGEHGRGFAVVAQEVGSLAQLSGLAATEIAQIVQSSIKATRDVASDNKTRVQKGELLVHETVTRMNLVIEKMTQIFDVVKEIIESSQEQGRSTDSISNLLFGLNQVSTQSSSAAEECLSSSAHLVDRGQDLIEMIREMRLLVGSNQNEVSNYRKKNHLTAKAF